jgi:hypothetical protein
MHFENRETVAAYRDQRASGIGMKKVECAGLRLLNGDMGKSKLFAEAPSRGGAVESLTSPLAVEAIERGLRVLAVIDTASALNMESASLALKLNELQGLGSEIYAEEALGGFRISEQHIALSNRALL